MTASTSTSFDLDRAGILRNAYQMLGITTAGQDPDQGQLAMGSDVLNVILKSWENKGVFQVKVERTTQTLTDGTDEYTTDADTLDIEIRTPYVTDLNGIDTRVEIIPRGRYMEITDKTDSGQPTLMYVEKTDRVRFILYPVPDSNYASITYARTKIFTEMYNGAVTTGLPAKYLKALILETAISLCPHFGFLAKMEALRGELSIALGEATNDDTERGGFTLRPNYG